MVRREKPVMKGVFKNEIMDVSELVHPEVPGKADPLFRCDSKAEVRPCKEFKGCLHPLGAVVHPDKRNGQERPWLAVRAFDSKITYRKAGSQAQGESWTVNQLVSVYRGTLEGMKASVYRLVGFALENRQVGVSVFMPVEDELQRVIFGRI